MNPTGMMNLDQFAFEQRGENRVLFVTGVFDHRDTQGFRQTLDEVISAPGKDAVIVDFSGVSRICSGVLRMLVLSQRRMSRLGRQLIVTGLHGAVDELFAMTRIDELLNVSPTVQAALAGQVLGPSGAYVDHRTRN